MGFLSKIGQVAGALGSIGSFAAPFMGYSATQKANQMQIASSREQMRFQERMSNTAYQRMVPARALATRGRRTNRACYYDKDKLFTAPWHAKYQEGYRRKRGKTNVIRR